MGNSFTFVAPDICSDVLCLAKGERDALAAERREYIAKNPPEVPMPVLFEGTDPERLAPELKDLCHNWVPTGKGLLVHGTTRKGKTRTAWYIADRLFKANPKANRFLFLTMFELEARLVASWGTSTWDKTMHHMVNVPLLFLDDLGKERMTERMASCLFALIDQRTMHQRSTIITTNLTGDTLLERFHDKETGAAFVARLKDSDLFERLGVKN
jgi:DNA replication protein DnaC